MINVKSLVAHRNEYGDKLEKKVGDEYDAPERAAEMLVKAGLVERVALAKHG